MNGHSGADGLVWRGKELSNETTMTANVRLSHLLWMHDSLFSFFFSLYLLLSPCFVWATCVLCILSFCINWKKRFTRNLPRITFLNMFDKEPEQLKATVCWHDYDDFFCRSRRQWHLFSLLSFYIQRPGTSIWMISGCRYIVGCFPQWGKIHQLKTMKMVL